MSRVSELQGRYPNYYVVEVSSTKLREQKRYAEFLSMIAGKMDPQDHQVQSRLDLGIYKVFGEFGENEVKYCLVINREKKYVDYINAFIGAN